jgi:hypothetical protein
MSRFSGRKTKGAKREADRARREANFRRGLSIWNAGTGMICIKPDAPEWQILDKMKRVANPLCYLRVSERHLFEKEV